MAHQQLVVAGQDLSQVTAPEHAPVTSGPQRLESGLMVLQLGGLRGSTSYAGRVIILDGREYGTADEIAEALGPGIASARGRDWAPRFGRGDQSRDPPDQRPRPDRRHEVGVDQATP